MRGCGARVGIVVEPVHREVATQRILLHRAEDVVAQHAAGRIDDKEYIEMVASAAPSAAPKIAAVTIPVTLSVDLVENIGAFPSFQNQLLDGFQISGWV